MLKKSIFVFVLSILLITSSLRPSRADTLDSGIKKPAEISSAIRAQAPLGKGTYTYFLLPIYDASLWTDADKWSMQAPFALSLRYHINIKKADLIARTIEEMNKNRPLSLDEVQGYTSELERLFPDLAKEDELTALYNPGNPLQLFHNGELTGSSDNLDFARRFYGIWLSEKTSAPDLRRELLDQPND